MADKKSYSEVIDQEGKIGHYQEAAGGGTPLPKGEKAPSKEWVAVHRKSQPRDEDGQFTYNSANRKPLKYGPSRGTTIPPFLRGLEVTYAKKSGNMAIKLGDKFYGCGKLSYSEFVSNFKEYLEGEGFGDYGDLSGKASGRTGNPQWGERHVEKSEGPARSAKFREDSSGAHLIYKGDVLEFESRFKEQEEAWKTSKKEPAYARDADLTDAPLVRWHGNVDGGRRSNKYIRKGANTDRFAGAVAKNKYIDRKSNTNLRGKEASRKGGSRLETNDAALAEIDKKFGIGG